MNELIDVTVLWTTFDSTVNNTIYMLCSMSIVLYIVDYLPKGVCTVFVNASAQIKMRQRSEMHHFYLIFLYKNNREDAAGWV